MLKQPKCVIFNFTLKSSYIISIIILVLWAQSNQCLNPDLNTSFFKLGVCKEAMEENLALARPPPSAWHLTS